MPKHNDYYAILNVLRDASEDEIRKAYRQLALKYHPDKNPSDKTAETKFREAKDAYDLLRDVLERRHYDQRNLPEPGRDLEYSLEVSLKNAPDGSQVPQVPVEEIKFEVEGRKIRLALDKGDGRYRLRGAGGVGAFGGAPGDLFVIVNADAREPDVPQTILGNDGAEMVLIPAGEFLMGSNDEDARDDEKPVHTVYLIVFFDHTFSSLDINRFLNSEFQRIVKRDTLVEHLQIMPLTVLTIEDLELLEPYLSDTPFHVHLDKWIAQFAQSGSILGFRAYLYSLIRRMPRKHSFMDEEFNRIAADMIEKFDSWGLK